MTREEARGLLMRCEAESYCPHYLQKFNCDGCKQRIALDMAIEALKAPQTDLSADAVQGEWIITKEGEYDGRSVYKTVCSECGHETFYKANKAHYCPNCGTRMVKGGDDE